MQETELNLNVSFLGPLQDLLDSASKLSASSAILSSSAIMFNLDLINKLLAGQETNINFKQENLINDVF